MVATPVWLIVGGLGVGLAYSGVTGQPFVDELRRAFTSPASSRTRRTPRPIGVSTTVPTPGKVGGIYVPDGTTGTSSGSSGGGGGGGAGARIGGDTSSSSSSGGSPCASAPYASSLVPIGQGSHKLAPAAAASFAAAEAQTGGRIAVTDSFRSSAQQADCHRRKPDLCAPAGRSCHEKGIAVDVVDMRNQRVIDALTANGWVRYDPAREPWHYSYGVRG